MVISVATMILNCCIHWLLCSHLKVEVYTVSEVYWMTVCSQRFVEISSIDSRSIAIAIEMTRSSFAQTVSSRCFIDFNRMESS